MKLIKILEAMGTPTEIKETATIRKPNEEITRIFLDREDGMLQQIEIIKGGWYFLSVERKRRENLTLEEDALEIPLPGEKPPKWTNLILLSSKGAGLFKKILQKEQVTEEELSEIIAKWQKPLDLNAMYRGLKAQMK